MKDDTTAKRDQFVMGLAAWFGFQFEYNQQCIWYWCADPDRSMQIAAQYSLSDGTPAHHRTYGFTASGSGIQRTMEDGRDGHSAKTLFQIMEQV